MMRAPTAVVATLLALVVCGCTGSNEFLPAGQYSGSTPAKQSVVIAVGATITLDGAEMRATPSKWLIGAHDKKLRMRCRTAAHETEIVCTIDRHGRTETDELLKL
jgi:hypothetical protein